MEKKLIVSGEFEDVYEINNHYFIYDKKDKICVIPYTLDDKALLDKLGVMEDFNYAENKKVITVINNYILDNDQSDLLAANRILFEIVGINITDAKKWMYLGSVFNNLNAESPIKMYAVNITDVKLNDNNAATNQEDAKRFLMKDTSKVLQSDDMLFLSAFTRLFQFFYNNSLINNTLNKK